MTEPRTHARTHPRTHSLTHSPNHPRTAALLYPLQRCCERGDNKTIILSMYILHALWMNSMLDFICFTWFRQAGRNGQGAKICVSRGIRTHARRHSKSYPAPKTIGLLWLRCLNVLVILQCIRLARIHLWQYNIVSNRLLFGCSCKVLNTAIDYNYLHKYKKCRFCLTFSSNTPLNTMNLIHVLSHICSFNYMR